jgi:hypothetical protein
MTMTETAAWDIINEGTRDDVVLAVDYSINGRHEAGFGELAAKVDPSFTIWETLAPPVGQEAGLSGADYVNRWLEEVRASGREVSAVLGYCASSAFASAIAEGIAEWQTQAPKVVLFDPTPATPWTILHFGFFKVIESLSASLSEEEITRIQRNGWEAAAMSGDDLEMFRTKIVAIYEGISETVFNRVGLTDQLGKQLVAWFRGYVSYLVAAGEFTGADLSQTTVISSSALEELPAETLREFKFDVDHADLLRSPEVAEALGQLLAD